MKTRAAAHLALALVAGAAIGALISPTPSAAKDYMGRGPCVCTAASAAIRHANAAESAAKAQWRQAYWLQQIASKLAKGEEE